jgi:hypothetical protein
VYKIEGTVYKSQESNTFVPGRFVPVATSAQGLSRFCRLKDNSTCFDPEKKKQQSEKSEGLQGFQGTLYVFFLSKGFVLKSNFWF